MATLGKREIGLIEDALKDIYEELTGNAVGFRKSILSNLIQGDNGDKYVTHTNALFDAFRKIEPEFSKLPLEKAIDFVKTSYDVLAETQQLNIIKIIPEMMWAGYDETANALEDIAIALNEKYDFDIDTKNIDNILVDMSEQLMGSDLKVGDIPEALEIQIRILDEMQYHEISQMYTAWTSTEQMRPMTIQLVELYDNIDNMPTDQIDDIYDLFEDNLWITDGHNQYLLDYDNPQKLKTKSIKNMIKFYFEQVGRLQTGYTNFTGAEHAFLDGFEISNKLDRPIALDHTLKTIVRDNLNVLLPNSKDPYQLLHSTTDFEGVGAGAPFQVAREYFTRYQDIIGTTISDNISDADFLRQEYGINQNMSLGEFSFQWNIADISDMDTSAYDAIPTDVLDTVGENNIRTNTFLDDLPLIQYPETFEGEDVIDRLVERPGGQSVEEFIKENNLTQREVDIINENLDNTKRIDDYIDIKPDVTPQQLRTSIEKVGQKTPNQIVTRYIDDAYKTFDKVNFPNTALKEQALFRLNRRIITTLGVAKEWIYDPKGGGFVQGEGTKLNEYLMNVQGIFPTEEIDPAGNRINFEQQILDEEGIKQLGEGDYWDNVIKGVVINAQEDLTIEGEVIPDTPELDTPTQALDELDEAISKSDGIDNLNKAKDIINKNPGVFRKIFSVLEKLDVGDQVITKGVLPALGRIGLGAATGPLGIAYAGYEMALLLSDIGNAAYKAQTTDESFWDNFGEVSDKYSIAYKISKPVYDIILDNLNNDLTEKEDEEILFSFNR